MRTQTPNEVAERIAAGIQQAVARGMLVGVTPHLNGDLGYYEPGITADAVRVNRVNVEGADQHRARPGRDLAVQAGGRRGAE